jgi:hypothetical protein
MRKITAGMFIALDGVVEAPDQWHFPYFNDEMGAAVGGQLGRRTPYCSAARHTTVSQGRGRQGHAAVRRRPVDSVAVHVISDV